MKAFRLVIHHQQKLTEEHSLVYTGLVEMQWGSQTHQQHKSFLSVGVGYGWQEKRLDELELCSIPANEGGESLVTETWPNYRFPHEKTGQTKSRSSFHHRLSYFLHRCDKLPPRNKCRHCGREGMPMGEALSSVGCVVRQLGIQW